MGRCGTAASPHFCIWVSSMLILIAAASANATIACSVIGASGIIIAAIVKMVPQRVPRSRPDSETHDRVVRLENSVTGLDTAMTSLDKATATLATEQAVAVERDKGISEQLTRILKNQDKLSTKIDRFVSGQND